MKKKNQIALSLKKEQVYLHLQQQIEEMIIIKAAATVLSGFLIVT